MVSTDRHARAGAAEPSLTADWPRRPTNDDDVGNLANGLLAELTEVRLDLAIPDREKIA